MSLGSVGGETGRQLDIMDDRRRQGRKEGKQTDLHVVYVAALECLFGRLESSISCVEKMVHDVDKPGLGSDDEVFGHWIEPQPIRICKVVSEYDLLVKQCGSFD